MASPSEMSQAIPRQKALKPVLQFSGILEYLRIATRPSLAGSSFLPSRITDGSSQTRASSQLDGAKLRRPRLPYRWVPSFNFPHFNVTAFLGRYDLVKFWKWRRT